MFVWVFSRTVKFKSPSNMFARRFRRVTQAHWDAEKMGWMCFYGKGKRGFIPADYAVAFGKDVSITSGK